MGGTSFLSLSPEWDSGLELEGQLEPGPVQDHLPFLNVHILGHYFGNAEVAQAFRSLVHRVVCSLFPGGGTGAHQLDHFVNTVWHSNVYRYPASYDFMSGKSMKAAEKHKLVCKHAGRGNM